jgi:WD40 repeat protein
MKTHNNVKQKLSLSTFWFLSFFIGNAVAQTTEQSIETVIQTGHYASVTAVAFNHDGEFAATGSADKTIKLWEVSSGREIRSYLGNSGDVTFLAFSPEGKYLASIDLNFTLKIWEVATSKEIKTISISEDKIISAAFSPDGNIITGSEKNHAILWDFETGEEIRRFKPVPRDILMQKNFEYPTAKTVEISGDGKKLLTGSNDRTAILFDLSTGQEITKYKVDRSSCTSCVISAHFSPDGKYMVTGHYDSIFLWNVQTGEKIRPMEGRKGRYGPAIFSNDGKYLVSTMYKEGFVWNTRTGKLVTKITGHLRDITSLQFNSTSTFLLTGSADRTAKIWKIPGGEKIITLRGYLNDVDENVLSDGYMYWVAFINEIKLSPDGKYIAIGKTGNNAKLMDFSTGRVIQTYEGHEGMVISIDFSPDGKYLATGSVDGTARVWDVLSGDLLNTFPDKISDISVFSVNFSPDGNYLVTGGWDGIIRTWDLNTGDLIQSISGHEGMSSYSVQFTHNGLYVISGGLDRKLKLFEIDTGKEIREFIGHTNVVPGIKMSPDGKHMLSGSWDGRAKLWDISTGMQVRRFIGHQARIHAVNFNATGEYLVTGSDDNTAKLWETSTGKVVRTFTGHSGTVSSVTISPDGQFLITGSHDGTIKTWDLETGQEMLTHIFIGENDWLVKTKEGYFDASEGAKSSIFFVKGTEIYNIDQFFEEFYRPGLLKEVYRNRGSIAPDANLLNRLEESPPPSVEIYTPAPRDTFEKSNIMMMVKITNNGGGIDEVKLLNNGKSLPIDNNDVKRIRKQGQYILKTLDVILVPGDNTLLVSAFSNGRIESEPDTITVYYKGTAKTATCYLIAIGINKYMNPSLDLNYAKADAKAFGKIINELGQRLFKKIEIHELYDKQATKANILTKLDELAETAKPEDVFFFYYAGHGSMVDNKFYFIPTESVSLYQIDKLRKESIYAGIIQDKFKDIQAQKQLVVLDACQSGGSAILLAQRGAMEEKALAQMSKSSGVHVLAAAESEQFAAEVGSLGHGLFTYVILEALRGGADGAPKDGKVTIYELKSFLDDQVPELSKKYKGQTQYPFTFSIGHDFPLVIN